MDIFKKASKEKMRFVSSVGMLSVEDLWDLPLTAVNAPVTLDQVAISLDKLIKDNTTVSFVTNVAKDNDSSQIKLDIVKEIIKVRLEEQAELQAKNANSAKKQRILAILDNKQDEALVGKSEEELRGLLADM